MFSLETLVEASTKVSKENKESISVNGIQIVEKDECKYLGIKIDKSLSYESQVKKILQKMATGIKTIKTIRTQLPTKTLETLLNSIVLCHLDYSALLIKETNQTLKNSLERQLNWALKTTFFRSSNKSSQQLRLNKNIISIQQRLNLRSLDYLKDYITGNKLAFADNLKLPSAKYGINSRTNKIIFQDHKSTTFLSNSFFHSTATLWNALPIYLRNLKISSKIYKTRLKRYFLDINKTNPPSFGACTWKNFRFI